MQILLTLSCRSGDARLYSAWDPLLRLAVEVLSTQMSLATYPAFAALCLQVLVVGAFWGSLIGLSRSIDALSPATFVEVGHVMMEDYGPIMSVLMPATVLCTLLAGLLVYWQRPSAGLLVLAGCVCFAIATATTLLVNVPIDEMMAGGCSQPCLPTGRKSATTGRGSTRYARSSPGGFAATLAGALLASDGECGRSGRVRPWRFGRAHVKHRVLRLLVEQMGFRSVAWEEDWTNGMQINDYLRSGNGNPDVLVSQMAPQWHEREVVDVLCWLRAFNADRSPKVQPFIQHARELARLIEQIRPARPRRAGSSIARPGRRASIRGGCASSSAACSAELALGAADDSRPRRSRPDLVHRRRLRAGVVRRERPDSPSAGLPAHSV